MAIFDVSFLNPKLQKKSQDYGYLTDQLSVIESQLSSDGKLSPGDYQILSKKAQELYAHPGLTPDQRSNVEVKIANYKERTKTTAIKESNDIGRLNNEVKDTYATNIMTLSNNPSAFLESKRDTLGVKLVRLKESIDQLDSASDDSSAHLNEYMNTLSEYNDTLQALEDVTAYSATPSGKPTSGFGAYITTNTKGQIVDVQIDRTGGKGGYAEVKAVYGGLPIYANTKGAPRENGEIVFRLGNQKFSGSDVQIPDPLNPGATKPPVLVSESQKQERGRGFSVSSQADPYVDVDFSQVLPQGYIRDGGWAEGTKGSLYQKQADGSYVKYNSASRDQLGINDSDIVRVPNQVEQGIIPFVRETVDPSASLPTPSLPIASLPALPQQQQDTSAIPYKGATTTAQPTGTSRTPSPTTRAPSTASSIAQRVSESVKNSFLGSLFR